MTQTVVMTPLEQLPINLTRESIELAIAPFLVTGPDSDSIWKSDYARRRKKAVTRMIKRIAGTKRRDHSAIVAEYHEAWSTGYDRYDLSRGPQKPAAWQWGNRRLALDGVAAARLRAPLLAGIIAWARPRSVLEVGCGNGINLFSIASAFPHIRFTGMDLTEAGITAARSLQHEKAMLPALAAYNPLVTADREAFRRIEFLQGSADAMPFADNQFDLVYTVLAVEQMERIRNRALNEIARVSGKYVAMIEPFRDANARGVRRAYALSRNYFRGSIDELRTHRLRPLWITDDFPQESFLGTPLVFCEKL